jgi:hypothetical protein
MMVKVKKTQLASSVFNPILITTFLLHISIFAIVIYDTKD